MRIHLLLPLLALPACAAASGQPSPEAGVPAGAVVYEVRSWGRLLLHWQVNPDGTGEIWRTSQKENFRQVRKHRLRLQGEPWRSFVADMEEARLATSGGVDCKKEIFDLPYGTVTWHGAARKQVYSFDAGCRSEKADEVAEILGAASTIVETMASVDAKPYITESADNNR